MTTAIIAIGVNILVAVSARGLITIYLQTLAIREKALAQFEENAAVVLGREDCTKELAGDIELMFSEMRNRRRAFFLHHVLEMRVKERRRGKKVRADAGYPAKADRMPANPDVEMMEHVVAVDAAYMIYLSTFLPLAGWQSRQHLLEIVTGSPGERDASTHEIAHEIARDGKSVAA